MKYFLVAILCAICALSNATKYTVNRIPIGKEWIAEYQAKVHVGTSEPDHFTSAFHIKGHLHAQKLKDNLLGVYLTDLQYNLHNGHVNPEHRLNNETWAPYLPVSAEVQTLTTPFQIVYDASGKLSELVVDQADKEFAVNIKKSIASILQFNWETLNNYKGKEFVKMVSEDTLYGACDVRYLMEPGDDDGLVLIKSFEPEKCHNHFNLKRGKNYVTFENTRVYKFEKSGENNLQLKDIKANGFILTYPQGGIAGVRFAKVFQTMTLKEVVAIANEIKIDNKQIHKTLKYTEPQEKCRELPLNALYDWTGGRRVVQSSEKLVSDVNALLSEYNDYLKENHISFEQPAAKNIVKLHQIMDLLENGASLEALQQIFNHLQEKSMGSIDEKNKLYLFVQLLPHVGTKSSAILIRNLIRKQKINTDLAIMILADMPVHLKCPNEKLLTELEDMLTLHKDDAALHNALILSFATLVRRTFEHFDEKSPILEKHIAYFVEKMNSATDYNSKVQYLQALSNIGIGSVLTQLLPIVTGDVKVDENLRLLALQAISPHLRKDYSLMYKIAMPILANRDLSTALRATAYSIYINTYPSYDSYMKLHLFFRTEPNERLYAFHYNTLRALSTVSEPSFDSKKQELASVLLRISRRPINDLLVDGTYYYEYQDAEWGFGAQLRDIVVDNDNEVMIHSRMLTRLSNVDYEMFSIYFRVTRVYAGSDPFGLKMPVDEDKKQDSPIAFNLPFELIIKQGGRTIMTYSSDVVTLEVIRIILRNFNVLLTKDMKLPPVIQMPFVYSRIVPTDLGVPIIFTGHLPIVHKVDFNFEQITENLKNKLKIHLKFTLLAHKNLNMRVYNPVADLYHGIVDVKSVAVDLPLNLLVDKTDKDFAVSFMRSETGETTGLQTYATTKVYIKGVHNKEELAKFNKDAKVYQTVAGGPEYKKRIPIADVIDEGTGQRLEAAFFNCNRPVSRGTFIYTVAGDETHDESEPLSLPLMMTVLQQYLILIPGVGDCGFAVQLHDLPDVDHFQLKFYLGKTKLDDLKSIVAGKLLSFVVQVSARTADNVDLVAQTLQFESNLDTRQTHVTYTRKKKDVIKKQVLLHFAHKQSTNGFDVQVTMDVDKEKSVMEARVQTKLSDEQERMAKEKNFIYSECYRQVYKNQILLPYTQECARAATSLNQYTLDVQINNHNHEEVSLFLRVLRLIRARYFMYRQPFAQTIDFAQNKHYHIDLVFPIYRDEYDLSIKTDNALETYQGVPRELNNIFFELLEPFFVFDELADRIDYDDIVEDYKHCLVNGKYILTDKYNIVPTKLESEYVPVAEAMDGNGTTIYTIRAKALDDTGLLAFKIELEDKSVEVIPTRDGYTVNDKTMTWDMGKQDVDDKFSVLVAPYPKLLLLATKDDLISVTFDDTTVRLDMPKAHVDSLSGKCFERKH